MDPQTFTLLDGAAVLAHRCKHSGAFGPWTGNKAQTARRLTTLAAAGITARPRQTEVGLTTRYYLVIESRT